MLICRTIDLFDVWVGLVLGFAQLGVVEAFESGCDVCEHGHVNFAVFCSPSLDRVQDNVCRPSRWRFYSALG